MEEKKKGTWGGARPGGGRKPGFKKPNAGRKPGVPNKNSENGQKSKNVSFRISEAELQAIKALAEEHEMTVSKYLIAAALGTLKKSKKG